jgi:hypothetical protein
MDAVNRILRYLKNCPGKGIMFSNNGHTIQMLIGLDA